MPFARSSIVTLVLAAGAGKRLGGAKALLAWPSAKAPIPLAIAHAEERLRAESGRVVVVIKKPSFGVLMRYVQPGIDLVVSDAEDTLGPAGSIAVGSSRLDGAELVVVTPVDSIPARAEIVKALLDRLQAQPELQAVRAIHRGKGGHPVVVRAAVLDRYREAASATPGAVLPPLRDHLRSLGDAFADEEIPDASVLIDLDRPSDVMGVLGTLPVFVR